MKVSRNSWHWRYMNKLDFNITYGYSNPNLCKYFWHLVLAVVGLPIAAILIGIFAVLVLGMPIWYWFDYQLFPLAIIVGTLEIVALLAVWRMYRKELRQQGRLPPKKYKEHPKLNIFAAWVAAKKQKVCPLIEYED